MIFGLGLPTRWFILGLWVLPLLGSPLALAQEDSIAQEMPEEGYIQESSYDVSQNVRALRLNDVIEQGLRENDDEEIRQYEKNLLDLQWDDDHEEFWLPQLKVELTTNPYQVGRLRSGSGQEFSESPAGSFSIGFEDYTVFNWGKDYLKFLNTKAIYQREKNRLDEEKRELKHELIAKFFEVSIYKKIEDIKRDQLRHASFVYRLNREKATLKKINRQEYYQARSEYLRAQDEFNLAKKTYKESQQQLAYLINDPVGTRYIIYDELRFMPLKVTYQESEGLAKENNPAVLDRLVELENAKRDYDVALRKNMPLPEFSVNLGAYRHEFGREVNTSNYRTGPMSSHVELTASLQASWSITGPGGLFNGRRTEMAVTRQGLAFRKKERAQHQALSTIRELHDRIQHFEDEVEILNSRNASLQRNFDTILENYLDGNTPFLNFKIALEEMSQSKAKLEQIKLMHVRDKLKLATIMGVEDFPGENFERLAKEMTDKEAR